jgi:hypothetical protein
MRSPHLKASLVSSAIVVFGLTQSSSARDYYVSPTGVDTGNNFGSFTTPFKTIGKAVGFGSLTAGDTIYLRGNAGSFSINSTVSIAATKSGTAANPIRLLPYPGEQVLVDFTPQAAGARGFDLRGNFWQIKDLTVQKAHDNGVFIAGSNNLLERLVVRQNQDSGIQISTSSGLIPANNLVLNCDSYENYDPVNHGENADGFAVKFRGLGAGNVLRGTRAWGNSDDGYDFWQAENGVTVENAWAWKNGINTFGDTAFAGDGNGIKLGHDSGTHVLRNMLVWSNPANGVDVNGNATQLEGDPPLITHGVQVYNVTSYSNGGRNFQFDESFAHILKNNISFLGSTTFTSGVQTDHNTWNGLSAGTSSFISLSDAIATGPRNSDGSLPISGFLRLVNGSPLINAGVDVGTPFVGSAPDLGAFEVGMPKFGDADLDGDVDINDLGILASNWQTSGSWIKGDFDFNGSIDINDLGLLASNWQSGVPSAPGSKPTDGYPWAFADAISTLGLPGAAVPEPTGLTLLIASSLLACLKRR